MRGKPLRKRCRLQLGHYARKRIHRHPLFAIETVGAERGMRVIESRIQDGNRRSAAVVLFDNRIFEDTRLFIDVNLVIDDLRFAAFVLLSYDERRIAADRLLQAVKILCLNADFEAA